MARCSLSRTLVNAQWRVARIFPLRDHVLGSHAPSLSPIPGKPR